LFYGLTPIAILPPLRGSAGQFFNGHQTRVKCLPRRFQNGFMASPQLQFSHPHPPAGALLNTCVCYPPAGALADFSTAIKRLWNFWPETKDFRIVLCLHPNSNFANPPRERWATS
jgi:hypothetical protein